MLGILEGVGDGADGAQPAEVGEVGGGMAVLDDGEEVEVRIGVEAIMLEADGAEGEQGEGGAAALEGLADGVEALESFGF
jgi:hypothetical protein